MPDNRQLATRCVHAGELADAHGSPHTPVYTATTFAFPSTAALLDVVEGRAAGGNRGQTTVFVYSTCPKANQIKGSAPLTPATLLYPAPLPWPLYVISLA
jgi:hypothetical protein